METLDLVKLRDRHNRRAALRAAGWFGLAALAWAASWLLVFLMVGSFLLWVSEEPHWQVGWWAAWIVTAVLLFEGIRQGWTIYHIERINRQYNRLEEVREDVQPVVVDNPYGCWYILLMVLLVAPHLTTLGLEALAQRVSMSGDDTNRACAALSELAAREGWTAAQELGAHASVLDPLARLKLIRSKVEGGHVLVRLDTDYS